MHWADYVGMAVTGVLLLAAVGWLFRVFTGPNRLKAFFTSLVLALLAPVAGATLAMLLGAPVKTPGETGATPRLAKPEGGQRANKVTARDETKTTPPLVDGDAVVKRAKAAFGKKIKSIRRGATDGKEFIEVMLRREPFSEEKRRALGGDDSRYEWKFMVMHSPDGRWSLLHVSIYQARSRFYSLDQFLEPLSKWANVVFSETTWPQIPGHVVRAARTDRSSFARGIGIVAVPTGIYPDSASVEVVVKKLDE